MNAPLFGRCIVCNRRTSPGELMHRRCEMLYLVEQSARRMRERHTLRPRRITNGIKRLEIAAIQSINRKEE